ncbi:hypothetical protein B0H13DRAFT_2287293 [Mycena leptocephala]|nr:hypothetical protein B0H13DRAFT_2287293 [Mycena leptocephala]
MLLLSRKRLDEGYRKRKWWLCGAVGLARKKNDVECDAILCDTDDSRNSPSRTRRRTAKAKPRPSAFANLKLLYPRTSPTFTPTPEKNNVHENPSIRAARDRKRKTVKKKKQITHHHSIREQALARAPHTPPPRFATPPFRPAGAIEGPPFLLVRCVGDGEEEVAEMKVGKREENGESGRDLYPELVCECIVDPLPPHSTRYYTRTNHFGTASVGSHVTRMGAGGTTVAPVDAEAASALLNDESELWDGEAAPGQESGGGNDAKEGRSRIGSNPARPRDALTSQTRALDVTPKGYPRVFKPGIHLSSSTQGYHEPWFTLPRASSAVRQLAILSPKTFFGRRPTRLFLATGHNFFSPTIA